jgi:uncharacterized protein (TIGR02246 family)
MEPTALVDRMIAAFNDQDPDAFARGFAEDAKFVSILGQRMNGRNEIAAGHTILFKTLLTGTRSSIKEVEVTPLNPDLVLMHVEWDRERLENATPQTLPPGSGVLTFVARRSGPDWELVAATNVQNSVPPGPPLSA